MSALLKQAAEHWQYVEPVLRAPRTEADYDQLVAALDELLEVIGSDDDHPLAGLASHMGDLVEAYDEQQRPMPAVTGVAALRYLMREHGLSQADLPEVGTQSVVSELLAGKRKLNARQVRVLTRRFGFPAEVFLVEEV